LLERGPKSRSCNSGGGVQSGLDDKFE
jgi:hypothetical protein